MPSRDRLADELASMANTKDCIVVLGVDDKTCEIVGVKAEHIDAVDRYIYEICEDSITPPISFQSFRMELPDSTNTLRIILKVAIPRSFFVHRSPGGYFRQQGNSLQEMSPEQLAHLFQKRKQTRLINFEELPVPRSSITDLNKELRERYTTRSSESEDTILLKRSLLVKEENGAMAASIAGILLCSEHPEKFIPSAFIEAVRYRGIRRDINYQVDAKKICGPLDQQIKEAMNFLKKNQTATVVKKPYRINTSQFSERAVFEALVNAVAHRDYSVSGPKIQFLMFDDRLEIYSPGPLAYTITVDNIYFRQATRNELITSLLAEAPVADTIGDVDRDFYIEKRGDGVPIIMTESEKLSGKKPTYKLINDSELLLTIYSAKTN